MKAKAILVGFLVSLNLAIITGFIFHLLFRFIPAEDLRTFTPVIRVLGFLVGIAANGLAGYVTGRIAKQAEITHTLIVVAMMVAVGIAFRSLIPFGKTLPIAAQLRAGIFTIGGMVLGGWLANWRNEKSNVVTRAGGNFWNTITLVTLVAVPVLAGFGYWASFRSLNSNLQRARERANLTRCRAEVKDILRTCIWYAENHNGHLPSDLKQLAEIYGDSYALFTNRLNQIELVTTNATVTDIPSTAVIRHRTIVANGQRLVGYVDGHVEVIDAAGHPIQQ